MAIQHLQLVVVAAGSAGTATGSTKAAFPIDGVLLSVTLDFSASAAATSDTTLKMLKNGGGPDLTLLTISNSATDAVYQPRHAIHTSAGAAITDQYTAVPISGYLEASIAQANAADTVTLTILYEVS